jgi:uncharacterized membrane protein
MYNENMETLHTIVLILHVFGAAIIIGIAFVTLIIEIKKLYEVPVLKLVELMWKAAGVAMGIQLLTGIYLAATEWEEIGKSPYFWIKIVLFFVLGGVVGTINSRRFKQMNAGQKVDGDSRWAIASLLLFLIIASLGVMIAESIQ